MRSIAPLLAISLILILTFVITLKIIQDAPTVVNGVEVNTVWYKPVDVDSDGEGPKINVIEVPEQTIEVHDEEWLNQNLYKVESYTKNEDGLYTVALVNVQGAEDMSFDDLRREFYSTPYSEDNHFDIHSGVNCQGMVCYIADWCQKNAHEFAVEYFTDHVIISVLHRDKWYRFNFTQFPEITVVE